jgi:cell division septation protein DedD
MDDHTVDYRTQTQATRKCARKGERPMKNTQAVVAMVSIAFVIAIGAMAGTSANAAIVPTVGLGTAANFSVLAYTKVENTGPTTINRDVGIHPGALTAVTGFPPGIVMGAIHAADGVALQAKNDLGAAYTDAANRSFTTQGALGGATLVGGVYRLGSLTTDLTGALTLNGEGNPNSVWIFQSPSTLITASASRVLLTNGASPCNVFWQVGSSATLGTGSSFVGTILAHTSITVTTGVTVDGRALADIGAVTLDTDTFISSSCRTGPTPPTMPPFTVAPGTATPVPAPIATFTPAPVGTATAAPTATPIGTVASSVTPTIAPTAAPIAAVPTATPAAVAGTQNLPSTSTGDPLAPLTMLGIGLTGLGMLLLLRRPLRHL